MDIKKVKKEAEKQGLKPSDDAIFIATFITNSLGEKIDNLNNKIESVDNKIDNLSDRIDKLGEKIVREIKSTRRILLTVISVGVAILVGICITILYTLLFPSPLL